MTTEEIAPQVIENAIILLNQTQQSVLLLCAKNLAGCDWAEAAEVAAIDENGVVLSVMGNGRSESHRVEFEQPVHNVQELRQAMLQLGEKADPPDGIKRIATATVETAKASRYLKALCNHFDRKATARYDDENGHIEFPFGECELQANENTLIMTIAADSEARFNRTKHVVADHLVRFGNKEELHVNWVDAAPAEA